MTSRRRQKAQGETSGSTWPGSGHWVGAEDISRKVSGKAYGGRH